MKCTTKGCKNEALAYRKHCATCRTRQYTRKNPVNVAYLHLKKSAKRRGKEFSITKEEFEKFCEMTGYIRKKGKGLATIDRVDQERGYHIDNIRMVSQSVNSKLYYGTLDPYWVPLDYCPF